MPGLEMRTKLSLFVLRAACAGIGTAAAYGFLWLCIHKYIVRDPDVARIIMFAMVGVGVVIGETIARRKLKGLSYFRGRKIIPFTY